MQNGYGCAKLIFPMKKPLWKFIDDKGTFASQTANRIKTLYFPLCNGYPIMSSISADLHGDIKRDANSFLLEPVSRAGLVNSKSSRNFWVYLNSKKIWPLDGEFFLEAGLLWQKITRANKKIGLKAKITSFAPSTGEPLEIMHVEISNISSQPVKFIPCPAIPIYGRSLNNIHDHRHVTSLLSRIEKNKYGVIVTPALLFDESGHKKNFTSYFVLGLNEKSSGPEYIYPTQEEFCGEDGDLQAPQAIINNLLPDEKINPQGKEPMAALRFKARTLKPKEFCSYSVLMGIVNDKTQIRSLLKKFNTPEKIMHSLNTTKAYWQNKSCENRVDTGKSVFDNWLRWVSIQPVLRKIFGCSFLPDFDYGKGGRGWRDLWQDCLSLILSSPQEVRQLLINNFSGVRIDGTNATIIGSGPGEFIADRNNISRVWMDHAAWPLLTVLLYIHQTEDLKILLEEAPYFENPNYKGTILEHLLLENLARFFNAGPHNHIRLEDADWNDGLDMAKENGESVAFSAMYAQNLNELCSILERLGQKNIEVFKELNILFDTLSAEPIDYSDINQKRRILDNYFQAVKSGINAEKISVATAQLINDLKKKADWISQHIRQNEWLKEGFFNGYYDNNKQRVEGKINGIMRMTLTGQVFAVMSGIATKEQAQTLFKNCKKYLRDKKLGGFHLNTDFKQEQPALGRAFSFVYGDKENGAFFNHMAVMFAYALYKQGFVKEGYEVLNSIYEMAIDTERSKIYPGLPEYFNAEGRGMYAYLTGSASWYILTVLTQMFGVRGEYGDFVIEPKLTARQFKEKDTLSLTTAFAGRKIEVRFINRDRKEFGEYYIQKVVFNAETIAQGLKALRFDLSRKDFLNLAAKPANLIQIFF